MSSVRVALRTLKHNDPVKLNQAGSERKIPSMFDVFIGLI
jgi:hypothetical protein